MVENIDFKIQQFEKFYYFLMKNAPDGYIPWFFPCEKQGKDPAPLAILKIDSTSKGSWHHSSARLNKEQCIEHIKQGWNIGISARKEDPLIIGDVDDKKYLIQTPKKTLVTISRKREGIHFFGWNKDESAKINLPTDYGEMRSENQYVLIPGSYVPFDLTKDKEKIAFEKLSEESKKDSLLGYYTLNDEPKEPKSLCLDDIPQFFKDKQKQDVEIETNILQREEKLHYSKEGKYSQLFNLKVSDIIGSISKSKRVGHPLHDSETDANFSLNEDGSLGHCWRHMVSLNPVQLLCVKNGYAKCEDAGTPHKGRGISKIRGDKKALEVAFDEALNMGLISDQNQPQKISSTLQSYYSKKDLAKDIWEVIPYFYDSSKMWWLWDSINYRWKIVDDKDILNIVEDNSDANTVNSKEKGEIIEAMQQYGRRKIPAAIKKTWIQFKDTIVDYKTGEEIRAEPKYFITNPIPWVLHKERFIETPMMDKIFEEWVGEDYVQTLYEIIAYCLIPDYPIHRLFCFIGEGMNGKSCFLKLLKKFIGEDNVASTELDTLISSRFEITRLHKKLICVMGETNFTEINKTSIIKKLTGQDTIGFEYKNKNPFEGENYAKVLIATNNLPTTGDKTTGFYRRWLIIDFPNKFSEKKEILMDIPEEEYEILTIKSLKILKDLMVKREFHKEGSIEDRAKKYEDHSDPLEKFMKEFTEEDLNGSIWKFEFEKRLNEWCSENRFRQMSEIVIGRKMKDKGIEQVHKQSEWLIDGHKKQLRAWLGVKWKEENIYHTQDTQETQVVSTQYLHKETECN